MYKKKQNEKKVKIIKKKVEKSCNGKKMYYFCSPKICVTT